MCMYIYFYFQLPQLNTHNEEDGEIIFPLSPSILEPPKEKPPPPPPSELSDDDETVAPTNKPVSTSYFLYKIW